MSTLPSPRLRRGPSFDGDDLDESLGPGRINPNIEAVPVGIKARPFEFPDALAGQWAFVHGHFVLNPCFFVIRTAATTVGNKYRITNYLRKLLYGFGIIRTCVD